VRRAGALAAAAIAALALTAAAHADKPTVRLAAADQAAARQVVIRRADLGTASGWSGGMTDPGLGESFPCTTYHPKQSDLVITGGAESTWKNGVLDFNSNVEILRTPAMVGTDWRRTAAAPQFVPCLRALLVKESGSSAHLDSFGRLSLPSLAPYTRGFRAVLSASSSGRKVSIMIDVVFVARGRTEISLTTVGPFAARTEVGAAEVRLARLLVARIRT